MKYYTVTFQYSETIYCSNLAMADSVESVKDHYSKKYAWVAVNEANESDVREATLKGKPIVTI